jgi:hypothetical protein
LYETAMIDNDDRIDGRIHERLEIAAGLGRCECV